jgi:hypothetical protein
MPTIKRKTKEEEEEEERRKKAAKDEQTQAEAEAKGYGMNRKAPPAILNTDMAPSGGGPVEGRLDSFIPDDENEKYQPTSGMRVLDEAKKKIKWFLDKHDRSSSAKKRAEYMDQIAMLQAMVKQELETMRPQPTKGAPDYGFSANPFVTDFTTKGGPIRSSS